MSLLSVKDVCKAFGKNEVLQGITFEVRQGEVLSIIGPSGSGKSTLLRCLTLLERVDTGCIAYEDLTMVSMAAGERANRCVYSPGPVLQQIRRRFGLVFQNFNLFPHMSVMQNIIEAPVHVLGEDKGEAEKRGIALLEKVGLAHKKDNYPFELSGGEKQRAAIARALAMNPDILCFDEPTSALDPELTGEVLKVMQDLAKEHITMVVVTHEMGFARQVASRIVFMDQGAVVEEGDPTEFFAAPKTKRAQDFLGKMLQM